jgi:hypothetical protein
MMKRPSVDPALIFGVSLVLSVVLWCPTLRATLHGDVDITDAAIRYFLALALSWAGVYGLATIVATSTRPTRQPTPPPAEQPARGRDDAPRAAHEEQASNAA